MDQIRVDFEAPAVEQGGTIVAARISGLDRRPGRLWYRIAGARMPDEIAISHAFAVSMINMAMARGCELLIAGPLSRGTLWNLEEYQTAWSCWMPDRFRRVAITPREVVADEACRPEMGAVVPFSGGLDSMYSAWSLKQQGRLGALVTIQGLDIALADTTRWTQTFDRLGLCARSLETPLYAVATNWDTFAREQPGYLGYFLPIMAAGLLVARGYGAVVCSSAYPYDHLVLPQETNPITDPLLGRPATPILHWGAAAHRLDKVAAIAAWPEALEHLRPCDSSASDGRACGRCRKCLQTAVAFLGLGLPVPAALGGRTPSTDDIAAFEMTPYARLGLRDAVDSARRRGITSPWVAAVERRIGHARESAAALADSAAREAALAKEVVALRQRLDYVLGGAHRSSLRRRARRVLRAVRGKTAPPGFTEPTSASSPLPTPGSTSQAPPDFVRTANGRTIYVDPADLRGAALVAAGGNLRPHALAMWRHLVAEGGWTHLVDVGANYGEMLVGVDVPTGCRLIAVEPNPHVGRHLERTLQGAGLQVELVRKAVTDRPGAADLIVDRTWSGMTAISVDRPDDSGHRKEPIRVDAVTLADLLAPAAGRSGMRVLIKIDVEGHEVAVLKGLADMERSFAAFAALIEITHLSPAEIAWLLERYTLEMLEIDSGQLAKVTPASARDVSRLLADGRHHGDDVVLRLR